MIYCATPKPGTVTDRNGRTITKAISAGRRSSYPIAAECKHCGDPIEAKTGPDEWFHTDGHLRCEYAKVQAAAS